MKLRLVLLLCSLFCLMIESFAQQLGKGDVGQHVVFRFVSGDDMFYVPWNGNGDALDLLCASINVSDLSLGAVKVDGYSETKQLSFLRCNRVKSELVIRKGMNEQHFTTTNNVGEFNGMRNVVVVTLPFSQVSPVRETAKEKDTKTTVTQEPKRKEPPSPDERKPEPPEVQQIQPEPNVITQESITKAFPYCLAVRTNLLYDVFLLPTLGVEWRLNPDWGFKTDVGFAYWGSENGMVQKIWFFNPEVRRYIGGAKRYYLGASGNFSEYNTYKGILAGLITDDTGYQGKMWNAGLTAGYQLPLSRNLLLDFNLGLGYTSFAYDSFTVVNKTRVYKRKNLTKELWGPTQAGVSFVWKIR